MWNYVLVTPVYNESGFVIDMIHSVLHKNVPPQKWIIVDDGSFDGTSEMISAINEPVIDLVCLPRKQSRAPGGEAAIGHVLARLNLASYDFLGRFDADIVLSGGYIEGILGEFEKDPRLGIAGGELWADGKPERQPKCHVRGALKMYRRECFQQIGGLDTCIGWDTLDETRAWISGWKTCNFSRYTAIHRRPTGKGLSALHHGWQLGKADYMNWSHPMFVTLKSAKKVMSSPLKGLALFSGFLWSYATRLERTKEPRIRLARRAYHRRRLRSLDAHGRD